MTARPAIAAGPGSGVVAVPPPDGIEPAAPSPDRAVVVRVPNWIGDAILSLPAVAALLDRFAEHEVFVMARRTVAPIFVALPRVAAVIDAGGRGPMRYAGARRGLIGIGAGLGVALTHSMGSAIELAVGGVERVWGYGGPVRSLALDVALPVRWREGRPRWQAYALLAAAVSGRPVEERYPMSAAPGDVGAVDELFAEARGQWGREGPVVALAPGSKAPSRRWPIERFAEVAARLDRRGANLVVVGAPADAVSARRIVLGAGPRIVDWTGRSPLSILPECFRRLDFLVTNDSGQMHVAGAVGTPLLALCGASDVEVTAPPGAASEIAIHPVFCRPCTRNRCAYDLGCLRGIPVDFVVDRVAERLGL